MLTSKEALIALANGEVVECSNVSIGGWHELDDNSPLSLLLTGKNRNGFDFQFRLKPHTITINGIEVPAPFEPKEGERFYYFSDEYTTGYASAERTGFYGDMRLGAWSTEEEIKQVVAALRSIFK